MGENEQNLDNLERLIRVLKREEKRNLNNVEQQKIEEGVRESQFEELNLAEYVIANILQYVIGKHIAISVIRTVDKVAMK